MVTLYSKPNCVQCAATKFRFQQKHIDFEQVDITKDYGAFEKVKSLGFTQAPVVVSDNDSWSGFQPEKIDSLLSVA